jgi:hypothetical protein
MSPAQYRNDHIPLALLDVDLHRPMQDDVHRLAGLFDGHHVASRLEDAAMRMLSHPVQLRGCQPGEKFDVRQQVASVSFLVSTILSIFYILLSPLPMGEGRDEGDCNNTDIFSPRSTISRPSYAATDSANSRFAFRSMLASMASV